MISCFVTETIYLIDVTGYTDVEAAESWLLENTPPLTRLGRPHGRGGSLSTLGRERGLISLDANHSLNQRRQLPPLIGTTASLTRCARLQRADIMAL